MNTLLSTAASLALLFASFPHAASFSTNSPRAIPDRPTATAAVRPSEPPRYHHLFTHSILTPPTTSSLQMTKDKEEPYDTGYVDGSTTGAFLMAFVLLINVWIFSIPTEFRRARICKEEDVVMYPNKNCITAAEWTKGVGDYYRNGGGIQFDFSIEGR
ncbi:hypothetical protein HJC23_005249 [Cyclotella cryptica]|uniref:Uncharacterized protein n=1 Tax=Cyclotella cryptica TaxID=29204 RepID=A0ABD3PK65_9STRA